MSTSADLILHNATVLTFDSQYPRAQLVAIKGSSILGVGRNEDLEQFKGVGTKVIDCQGKTIVPGFNDAHCHPLALASSLLCVDCSPSSVRCIADVQNRIRHQADQSAPGVWIKAVGYNEFYISEKRHPTRWDLDEAAPHHPVKLMHRTGHACVLNSLAMRLVGITVETPEPPGGLIERDLNTGEPNGLLIGMNEQVDRVIPPLSQEERERAMRLANQEFLSQGITSLHDASWTDSLNRWNTIRELQERGVLQIRVSMMVGLDTSTQFRERGLCTGAGDSRLRVGAVKLLVDEVSGSLNPSQEELNQWVYDAQQAGFQVAIHCVEETTVEAAINALEKALPVSKSDHRNRLEHCSVCPPGLVQQLKSLQAMVVTQPLFLYYGGARYLDTVQHQQLQFLYPMGSWVNSNIPVAAGSDAPVVPLNSFAGIYAAITRMAETGQLLEPHQAISIRQALEMHTIAGAYASFEEETKGSLSPGKLADMVILSDDPISVSPEALGTIEVLMTVLDGQVVWEK